MFQRVLYLIILGILISGVHRDSYITAASNVLRLKTRTTSDQDFGVELLRVSNELVLLKIYLVSGIRCF